MSFKMIHADCNVVLENIVPIVVALDTGMKNITALTNVYWQQFARNNVSKKNRLSRTCVYLVTNENRNGLYD